MKSRILASSAVAAALLIGSAPPAIAHAPAAAVEIVGPADGAVVADDTVVLTWRSTGPAAGYEVRWAADGVAGGTRTAASPVESYELADLAPSGYRWQVRALPDGAWSPEASFVVDVQLPTLPVDGEPRVGPAPEAAPVRGGNGAVWLASACAFAVLLLAAVAHAWRRERREA